jgi:hypothetical protein
MWHVLQINLLTLNGAEKEIYQELDVFLVNYWHLRKNSK